jgi:hypothetical protein
VRLVFGAWGGFVSLNESDLQRALVTWCRMRSDGAELIFAIPNGGKRDAKEAMSLKHQGVTAGVPDLFLPVMRGGYGGLFIELKNPNGKGVISKEQIIMMEKLKDEGYFAFVSHDFEMCKNRISLYLGQK